MAKYNSQGNLTYSYQATKGWLTPSSSSASSWGTLGSQITYDSAGLFPTQTSNALGQSTYTAYNQKLPWLPKQTTQIDNTQQWFEYDPFGRLFAIYDSSLSRGLHNDASNPASYDLFGQAAESTPPNGIGSQMVYGERFTLGYDVAHRATQQFSDKMGLLVAVDELKEGFVDYFDTSANLSTNWPVSAVGGSTGTRTVSGGY